MSLVRLERLKDPNYVHLTCACQAPTPVAKFIGDMRDENDVALLEELGAAHAKTCPGGVAA